MKYLRSKICVGSVKTVEEKTLRKKLDKRKDIFIG